MQKLGKPYSETSEKTKGDGPEKRKQKAGRSHIEDQQASSSKSKKITKIIHNTVIFYVDEKGERKTIFYQKLRDRKSRENKTNEQKIRRQALEFNWKLKSEAQATCIKHPEEKKQQESLPNNLNWVPNYYCPFPFIPYPPYTPLS